MMCPLCPNEQPGYDSVGVCDACGVRIARRYKERLLAEEWARKTEQRERWAEAQRKRREREALPLADQYAAYEQPKDTSWVYYVRIHDHIKIGYTTRVLSRLRALRVPVGDLLALEPGGYAEEQERHKEFDHARITKRWENFRPTDDLLAHIKDLNDEHGLPKWIDSPRRGRNGPVEVRRI